MKTWKTPIICCNVPFETSCMSLSFPMIQYGHNVGKLDAFEKKLYNSWIPYCCGYMGSYIIGGLSFIFYGTVLTSLGGHTLTPQLATTLGNVGASLCLGCYAGKFRTRIRNKYNIQGSYMNDCIIHSIISPCALCQEAEELRLQEEISQNNIGEVIFTAPYAPLMTVDENELPKSA